jgi:hypothetical protein
LKGPRHILMHDRSGSPRIDRGLLRESRADCSGELDFIGSYEQRRSERGWHRSDELPALAPLYELERRAAPTACT